jgi:hypothetical protein
MHLAFKLDIAFYYLGVASQPFKVGAMAFGRPMFSNAPSVPFYHFIRFYNRRFAQMARCRRRRNQWGRRNAGQRLMFPGFVFGPKVVLLIARTLLSWAALELKEGWRSWFASNPGAVPATEQEIAAQTTP